MFVYLIKVQPQATASPASGIFQFGASSNSNANTPLTSDSQARTGGFNFSINTAPTFNFTEQNTQQVRLLNDHHYLKLRYQIIDVSLMIILLFHLLNHLVECTVSIWICIWYTIKSIFVSTNDFFHFLFRNIKWNSI